MVTAIQIGNTYFPTLTSLVAALLVLSLLCAGGARAGFRRAPVPVAAE